MKSKKKKKHFSLDTHSALKKLVYDFFAALKEEKLFGKLIANCRPIMPLLEKEENIKNNLRYNSGFTNRLWSSIRLTLQLDDEITYCVKILEGTRFCETLASSLHVLNNIIQFPVIDKHSSSCLSKFDSSFIRFYCKKYGIKAYPNPMMFGMWFGTLFTIIGYLTITSFLFIFVGKVIAFGYAIFTLVAVLTMYVLCYDIDIN